MNTLFTIGHSNHQLGLLLELLRRHRIEAVADVRSHPHSARLPQFNRPLLEQALREKGLRYVFLGRELGARREEPECYVDGQARYDRIVKTTEFSEGLQRLLKGLAAYRVALLCAEKDPLTCHRTILVCRQLRRRSFPIQHILADGSLESHEALEDRLLLQTGLAEPSLFATREQQLEQAYDEQGLKIAFRQSDPVPDEEVQSAVTL